MEATQIDLYKLTKGTGWAVEEPRGDTPQIPGRKGHVYADRGGLVVSMDRATTGESRKLRRLGRAIMDGDDGELSVRIDRKHFLPGCRLIQPRQETPADEERRAAHFAKIHPPKN